MAATLRVVPAHSPPFDVPILYTATIGRTPENTVCLNFSPTVSRQHAIIRCHNGYEYQIMDLGSRNGTFVDDKRVVMPVTLQSGSRIRIANNEMTFEQASEFDQNEAAVTIAGGTGTGPAAQVVDNAAILVCDIRGFSTQSEILTADVLAQTLGQWFRDAGNLIQRKGGIVDKFIGDAILAYWQEKPGPPRECENAFHSAIGLLDLANKLHWPESDRPFAVGIAMHYGRVAFGNIGLVAQRDATIIGNAVNTAFRLEMVMKELGQKLLVSHAFAEALQPTERARLHDLGRQKLKGKNEMVHVYGMQR